MSATPGQLAPQSYNVALVGLGSIGISFAALHLRYGTGVVTVYDNRPDLQTHLQSVLPGYLGGNSADKDLAKLQSIGRFRICETLRDACASADIVQEQGPENITFKKDIWEKIERHSPKHAHFWSSTSGIAASLQNKAMSDASRLLVVHPFNPPHILPLIEIVPSSKTSKLEVEFARTYFQNLGSGHRPVVINKELPGFVGNRLAYCLFREAAYLVSEGVVGVEDLDTVVEASLGPRFAVQGPFKAYHMGGGAAGIQGFFKNLRGTIQDVWDTFEYVDFENTEGGWEKIVVEQTEETYGMPTPLHFLVRDRRLREVLKTQESIEKDFD